MVRISIALAVVASLAALDDSAAFKPSLRPRAFWHRLAKPDNAAYGRAESASDKFGAQSDEARLAWEEVTDLEDRKEAFAAIKPGLDEQCDVEENAEECMEFEKQMALLKNLQKDAQALDSSIQSTIEDLQQVQLSTPSVSVGKIDESAYQAAKKDAEDAAANFGADSPEARAAWDVVYEIEAADDEKIKTTSLEEECLVSTSAKCVEYKMALDSLQNAIISSEKNDFNKSI